jgi:hypothetical protein
MQTYFPNGLSLAQILPTPQGQTLVLFEASEGSIRLADSIPGILISPHDSPGEQRALWNHAKHLASGFVICSASLAFSAYWQDEWATFKGSIILLSFTRHFEKTRQQLELDLQRPLSVFHHALPEQSASSLSFHPVIIQPRLFWSQYTQDQWVKQQTTSACLVWGAQEVEAYFSQTPERLVLTHLPNDLGMLQQLCMFAPTPHKGPIQIDICLTIDAYKKQKWRLHQKQANLKALDTLINFLIKPQQCWSAELFQHGLSAEALPCKQCTLCLHPTAYSSWRNICLWLLWNTLKSL